MANLLVLPNLLNFADPKLHKEITPSLAQNDPAHKNSLSPYPIGSIPLPLIHVSCSAPAITFPSHTTLPLWAAIFMTIRLHTLSRESIYLAKSFHYVQLFHSQALSLVGATE